MLVRDLFKYNVPSGIKNLSDYNIQTLDMRMFKDYLIIDKILFEAKELFNHNNYLTISDILIISNKLNYTNVKSDVILKIYLSDKEVYQKSIYGNTYKLDYLEKKHIEALKKSLDSNLNNSIESLCKECLDKYRIEIKESYKSTNKLIEEFKFEEWIVNILEIYKNNIC